MNTTKGKIAQAFREIVCRKSFQKITISDIARECEMTRENFYYHFRDKFDIIRWILEDEVMGSLPETDDFLVWLKTIVKEFDKDKIFYTRIINEVGKDAIGEILLPVLWQKIKQRLEETMDQSVWIKRKEKLTFVTSFFADAILEFIFRSILEKEAIPMEMINQNLEFLVSYYLPFLRYEKEL